MLWGACGAPRRVTEHDDPIGKSMLRLKGIRPHGPTLDPMTTAGLIPGPYDIRNYEYDT